MPENTSPGGGLIFMTARNCEMHTAESIMSLARQTHENIHVLYVDDASEDSTGDIAQRQLRKLFPNKHTYIRNDVRFGKAKNVWEHLRPRTAQTQFIAVLDGDDQLIDISILNYIAKSYEAGRDVVWTNYVTDNGMVGGNGKLDPNQPPRTQGWKTSHLFSFRADLLDTVPESYFKNSRGEWLPAACDIALALPILDQTRRYEFIPVNAHRYTATNPYSHHNMDPNSQGLNSTIQRYCAHEVFNKPPLPLLNRARWRTASKQKALMASEVVGTNEALDPMVATCPALRKAQSVVLRDRMPPKQIQALHQIILQKKYGNILHIGTASSAVYLAAIVAEMADVTLTCLTSSSEQAAELREGLSESDLLQVVKIVEGDNKFFAVEDVGSYFPDAGGLGTDHKFSIIVVDTRDHLDEVDFATIAFPAIASAIEPSGFNLGVITGMQATASVVAKKLSSLSSGLEFRLGGIGGSGLVISAGA